MSEEQQHQTTATAVQTTTTSACPHPEAAGMRWGDPISEERQRELQGYLDQWEKDQDERKGPFDRTGLSDEERKRRELTGADVSWLAKQSESGTFGHVPNGHVPNLHLEGAVLIGAHLEGAVLTEVHLEGAVFAGVHLEGADIRGAHLEGADLTGVHLDEAKLSGAHLERAVLSKAHLEGAFLPNAHLERASLFDAHLERTYLSGAHLEGADLRFAHLEGADIHGAHLEGTDLTGAHLERADLTGAHLERAKLHTAQMDKATRLYGAALDRASLDQLSFDGANLAVVKWESVQVLGDEVRARATKDEEGKVKHRQTRINDYEAAVRAHLQLAAVMRSQGMRDQADRFSYRAQVLQRGVLRFRLRFGAALGSWFLDFISGYGYKPMRSFITYLLVILGFAAAYFALGGANGQSLTWNEALVISMTAFHGRGFFSSVFQPGDLQAAVAAVEAFIGLLIEIVFIATFTQRFFAR